MPRYHKPQRPNKEQLAKIAFPDLKGFKVTSGLGTYITLYNADLFFHNDYRTIRLADRNVQTLDAETFTEVNIPVGFVVVCRISFKGMEPTYHVTYRG